MNEISKEKIEINGKEYTLFLNRKGLVAWEKFCKDSFGKLREFQDKYKDFSVEEEKEITLNEDTNPFEEVEKFDDIDKDSEILNETFKRLYWIMLYTEHKLTVSKASKLYDEGCLEYGSTQMIQLAQQMIEDMNKNNVQLKNLPALRQQ